jgi:tetratricopeptide (TPR) repeat protein
VALLTVAVAVRIGHLVELRADPFIDRPIMDAEYHDLWARSIVAGQPFGDKVFFRAPLYPYFLAVIYAALGTGPWAPRIVQGLLGIGSLILLHRIARRLVGKRVGILALALAVLYDLFPFYEGELLLKAVLVFLDLLAMERFVAYLRDGRDRDAILSGAVFGLSAITRPNILAVVPVLALLAAGWARRRRPALLLALAALPAPLAVTGLNWVRGGDAVFIASQGGLNFFLGNNRASDGWSAVAPELRPDWWGGYEDMIRIAEKSAGRSLRPSEVSSYWTRRALEEIAADPARWVRLLVRKTYLWFGAEELSNNRDIGFWIPRFPVVDALPVRYALLAPLAALGAFCLPWRRSAPLVLFVVPYALSFIAFFVTSRYRLVTVPFLAILAAAALDRLACLARARATGALAVRLAALAALFALLSSGLAPVRQPSPALSYGEIARREMERGRWADAEAACRQALAHEPTNLDARHDLGVALREGGQPEAALVELEAVATERNDASSWNNVALTLRALGRPGEAHAAFDRAIAADPRSAEAWLNSALLAEEQGDWEHALVRLDRGGALRPDDPVVWYHRGVILAALGRGADARAAFEQALRIAPGLHEARVALAALQNPGVPADNRGVDAPPPVPSDARRGDPPR